MSNPTIVRVVLLVILSFVFLSAVKQAANTLLIIFTAMFLSLAFNNPVRWLATHLPGKRRGNRSLATGLSFLIIILMLAGFLASIVPPLVRQTVNFVEVAPQLVDDARDENSALGGFIRRYGLEQHTEKLSGELSDRLDNIGSSAVSTVGKAGSSIISVLTILVLTFMMLVEGPRWKQLFYRLVPAKNEPRVKKIGADMYRVVTGYVNGQVTLATLAAVFITPMLFLFGVNYPIAMIVVVFICGLIPLVGATIGAVIVGAVALFTSPYSAVGILIYYILYQQVENYVLQPKIQSNSTNMSPLLVFSSVLIGVNFGGLVGGLFAIPVAGCIRIVILDYLESRNLISKAEVKKATTVEA